MENEVRKIVFLEEKTYQIIKKKMRKNNDYFSKKELKKIGVI